MSRRRVAALRLALVALACAGGAAPAGSAADGALAPYAELARTPRARALLARARAVMARHWDPQAAPDSGAAIAWPGAPVAVYVSLVEGRTTRSCVGRAGASFATLSGALQGLAIEALTADRRHAPVRREELERLRVVITFGGEGEVVADPMLVDPAREGLSVSTSRGTVAFLPGEARTVAWALREARRIGVLEGPVAGAICRRFPVVVLAEPETRAAVREEPDEAR